MLLFLIKKEKDEGMTREEVSLQDYGFSNVAGTSPSVFKEIKQPSDFDFAECFYYFIQRNKLLSQGTDQPQPLKAPDEKHYKVLSRSHLKLTALEAIGKEYIEEYLRHKYLRNFQTTTIRVSYIGLSKCFT